MMKTQSMRRLILVRLLILAMMLCVSACAAAQPTSAPTAGTRVRDIDAALDALLQMGGHHQEGWLDANTASPLSILAKDCFSRFSRDSEATPAADEVLISPDWRIVP